MTKICALVRHILQGAILTVSDYAVYVLMLCIDLVVGFVLPVVLVFAILASCLVIIKMLWGLSDVSTNEIVRVIIAFLTLWLVPQYKNYLDRVGEGVSTHGENSRRASSRRV